MTTLAIGSSATVSVADNGTVKVASNGGFWTATFTQVAGASGTETFGPGPARKTFGPFSEGGSVTISNTSANQLDYDSGPQGIDPALQALVSAAGTTIWANRAAVLTAGLTNAFFTDIGIGGSFWFYAGGRWRPSSGRVVLRNLTSSVTHTTTTRTVMDFVLIPAGLWQDGDNLEMEWCKTLTGTDTDTTETALGTVAGTFGEALNLTTATLTNANPMVNSRWRWRRLGATSVRPVTITGSVGLGGAGGIVTDPTITTNLDSTDAYLQISGKLTTGGGPITALRAHTVTLIAGA